MFRASSAHLQEDTVVHMQHMVLSLSTGVRGGLSVHSLSENWLLGGMSLVERLKTPYQQPSPPTPTVSSLYLSFPHQNSVYTYLRPICATYPAHLIYHNSNIWWGGLQVIKLRHSPATSTLLGPNIFLSALLSNTLSLRSSLNLRHQDSHPHKWGKIIVLYISASYFRTANRKTKVLHRMIASIPRLQSLLNLFVNAILIIVGCSQIKRCKGKGTVHPRTGLEGSEGE